MFVILIPIINGYNVGFKIWTANDCGRDRERERELEEADAELAQLASNKLLFVG